MIYFCMNINQNYKELFVNKFFIRIFKYNIYKYK